MNELQPHSDDAQLTRRDDTVSLLDFLNVLARRKLLIGVGTALGAALTLGFLVLSLVLPVSRNPLPDRFTSEALVLIENQSGSATDQLLNESNLGSLLNLGSVGGSSFGQLALELLASPSLLDEVAAEHDFVDRFGIEEFPVSTARNILLAKSEVEFDSSTGILSIAYEDTDPVFAQQVAESMMLSLERRFRAIGLTRDTTEVSNLTTKLSEVETRIAEVEAELTQFQRENNVISVENMAQQRAGLEGQLRSDLILKDVEIEAYRELVPANDPTLQRLLRERTGLAEIIADLETGTPELDSLMTSQRRIPELAIQYARLERDLMVQTEIYTALSGQLELARLSVAGEQDIFQILERPEVPERKSAPSRSLIAIIVTVTIFFVLVFLAFVLEYFASAARDPEENAKLEALKDNLRLRRKNRT
ncbi:MAG: GumC family protein [Spirochaetota bacterium]